MSMLQGTVSLKRFLVLGPVPDEKDLQSGLEQDQFRPFQDGLEEERMGWCDWRNPLITPPDENWVSQERFAVFGLRIDTRRVPPALLKAHVDLRLQALQKEKDLAFIGKEARIPGGRSEGRASAQGVALAQSGGGGLGPEGWGPLDHGVVQQSAGRPHEPIHQVLRLRDSSPGAPGVVGSALSRPVRGVPHGPGSAGSRTRGGLN